MMKRHLQKQELLKHTVAMQKAQELSQVFFLPAEIKAAVVLDCYVHIKAAIEDFARLDGGSLKLLRPSRN